MPTITVTATDPITNLPLCASDGSAATLPFPTRTGITSNTDGVNASLLTLGDAAVGGILWADSLFCQTSVRMSDVREKEGMRAMQLPEAMRIVRDLPIMRYRMLGCKDECIGVQGQCARDLDPALTRTISDDRGTVVVDYDAYACAVACVVRGLVNGEGDRARFRRYDAFAAVVGWGLRCTMAVWSVLTAIVVCMGDRDDAHACRTHYIGQNVSACCDSY